MALITDLLAPSVLGTIRALFVDYEPRDGYPRDVPNSSEDGIVTFSVIIVTLQFFLDPFVSFPDRYSFLFMNMLP